MSEAKTLGDHIKILSGFPFPSTGFTSERNGQPIIRIRDLQQQNPETYFTGDYDHEFLISKGDVLVGMDGDFNAIKWHGPPSLLNQRVCKITTKDPEILDQGFLYHSLQPQLTRIHKGTAQTTVKHLSTKDLYGIDAELPPLPEQKKIAEILSGIDRVLISLQLQERKIQIARDEVIKSFFDEAVRSDGLAEIRSFGKIITGSTPPTSNPLNYGDAVPFISPGDINDGEIVLRTKSSLSESGATMSRILAPLSVCVVCIGSTIGKVALTATESATNQQINSITQGSFDPYFMLAAMFYVKDKIRSAASTHAVPIINKSRFGEILIPNPSADKQAKLGRFIESSLKTLSFVNLHVQKYQNLKQALMADLLSGRKRVSV